MVARLALENHLTELLNPNKIKDYCPNGLQVQGKFEINKIVTGVTASQALLEKALAQNADAVLVHHGYFWKGENPCVTGMKHARLKLLLDNNINLFAYHLPLDLHHPLGNNIQLAKQLNIKFIKQTDAPDYPDLVFLGELDSPMSGADFAKQITNKLNREPLYIPGASQVIKTIAWCTGGAQNFIEAVVPHNVDAYLTGEVSEQTVHIAREYGLHFYAAGHHATERYGIKALGEHLAKHFNIEHHFIDVDNPV